MSEPRTVTVNADDLLTALSDNYGTFEGVSEFEAARERLRAAAIPKPEPQYPVVHRLPSIEDGTVEGRLVDSLRDLGDAFGPRGVARAAAEMAGATLKTPEEQAVLDAADELVDWWHRGSTAVFTRTERRLVDAVRAYQATKTQEGEG